MLKKHPADLQVAANVRKKWFWLCLDKIIYSHAKLNHSIFYFYFKLGISLINKLHQSLLWSKTWQEPLIIVQTVMNTSTGAWESWWDEFIAFEMNLNK